MIRTLWATAALLAIFAMHGVASHGAAHDPGPMTTSSSTAAHGEPDHDLAVAGLCAAVLATSAILLLVGLRRPRSGLLGLLPRAVTAPSYPFRVRTGLAPPDLHALSILRC